MFYSCSGAPCAWTLSVIIHAFSNADYLDEGSDLLWISWSWMLLCSIVHLELYPLATTPWRWWRKRGKAALAAKARAAAKAEAAAAGGTAEPKHSFSRKAREPELPSPSDNSSVASEAEIGVNRFSNMRAEGLSDSDASTSNSDTEEGRPFLRLDSYQTQHHEVLAQAAAILSGSSGIGGSNNNNSNSHSNTNSFNAILAPASAQGTSSLTIETSTSNDALKV